MGNDGGSIARRDELVKVKSSASKANTTQLKRAQWTLCRLSSQPLREPLVADGLGRLYNKEAVVNWLIEKKTGGNGAEEKGMGHIRGLKDVTLLKIQTTLTSKSTQSTEEQEDDGSSSSIVSPFSCPLTGRPMNGSSRFVYILSSGAVMSEAGLKAIVSETSNSAKKLISSSEESTTLATTTTTFQCPITSLPFQPGSLLGKNGAAAQDAENVGDVILLNPSEKEEEILRVAMYKRREAEKDGSRKRKKERGSNGDLVKDVVDKGEGVPLVKKQKRLEGLQKTHPDGSPSTMDEEGPSAPISATQLAALAAKQVKDKPMNSALASIYGHGLPKGEKEAGLVRGTGMGT